MKSRGAVRLKSYVASLVLVLSIMGVGCGQSSYVTPILPPPAPQPAIASMQGSWEIVFQSSVSPNNYKVLELNLTQAGTHVFAGSPSSLVFQATSTHLVTRLPLTRFGGQCDSGAVGSVIADATLSNQGPTLETVSFTFTETGALGSAVTTASASTNGSSILSGTYSIPAACGFPADQGTFSGYQDSVHFAGDVFSGTLNSGADVVVANFTSSANSFDLAVSGTDNGAQFALTGSSVGFSLNLTGNFAGKAVSWFGLYDPTYNTFLVYDSNAHLVGNLHSGANAQSAFQSNGISVQAN